MTNNLPVPRDGLFPATRFERKLAQATSQELALVRAHEGIAASKIEAIEAVGQVALSSVASLSAIELVYMERDPHAAARLKFTADAATMAINRRIERFERNLG
jgi:hypothetical protein